MAYLCKDKKTREIIKEYIDRYIGEQRRSPSIRDIAAGTGISRAMVQRYMAAMRADGEIDYGRRDIETDFTRRFDQNNVAVAKKSKDAASDGDAEYFSIPRSWVGEGEFFMLVQEDDSMTGIGINEGDEVIVRATNDFDDGDIVAADINGALTLRVAYSRASGVMLSAENPKYSDKMYDDSVICGVALKAIKDLSRAAAKAQKEDNQKDLQVFLL